MAGTGSRLRIQGRARETRPAHVAVAPRVSRGSEGPIFLIEFRPLTLPDISSPATTPKNGRGQHTGEMVSKLALPDEDWSCVDLQHHGACAAGDSESCSHCSPLANAELLLCYR